MPYPSDINDSWDHFYDDEEHEDSYDDDGDQLLFEEDGQFYLTNDDDYWDAEDNTWDQELNDHLFTSVRHCLCSIT